jgi:hypothetical protein
VVSEEGDVLQGRGFESDAHMDNWRILSSVTGIFQDAARRLKEEDKSQAKEIESRDSAQAAATPTSSVAGVQPSSSSVAVSKQKGANTAVSAATTAATTVATPAAKSTNDSAAAESHSPSKVERGFLSRIKNKGNRAKARQRDE